MLHLFSEPELGPQKKNNSFQIGSFNSALKSDVPNMGWAMFYVDEFAERSMLSGLLHQALPLKS
jgi:hypothetical protein